MSFAILLSGSFFYLILANNRIDRVETVVMVAVIREGLTSKQIGKQLFISERTVKAHIHNIYRKCDVINRVELINKISRYS